MIESVDLPNVLLPEGQYLNLFDSESDDPGDLSNADLVEVSLRWLTA